MMKSRTTQPPGVVSIVVVVGVVAIGLVLAVLLRQVAVRRGQIRAEERRVQADWLAESGLERASSKLAGAVDYAGETWAVPASELGGDAAGTVTITIEPGPDGPTARAVADYPSEGPGRSRRTKQALFRKPNATRGDDR